MHNIDIPAYAVERGRLMRPDPGFDPKKTAVIAIDFQRFFIDDGQPMGNAYARDALKNVNRINAAVRAAGGIVVFTQHSIAPPPNEAPKPSEYSSSVKEPRSTPELLPGSASYELHPDLVREARDLIVVKHQSSPLHPNSATGLDDLLRERGIDTVIIAGLVSNGCCDCTARDAFQYGYQVVFSTDATAAMTDDEHNAALLNLSIYYAELMTSEEIISAVAAV